MPDELDPQLWVRLRGKWSPDPQLRWLIAGNAHTHRGHFSVVQPEIGQSRTVNLGDVAELSAEARCWIDGFLAGQEPSFAEFLGLPEEPFTELDGDFERWLEFRRRFRTRGWTPPLAELPADDPVFSKITDPPLWLVVGGRFRQWDGSGWTVLDPQPVDDPLEAWAWPGTICEQRRHHHLDELAGRYLFCADCHQFDGEFVEAPQ